MLNYVEEDVTDCDEMVAAMIGAGSHSRNLAKLDINLKNCETQLAKPSVKEPKKQELKELQNHLKYSFMEENDTLLVIVVARLLEKKIKALVEVLKKHMKTIGLTIATIVGIPSGICTHKIQKAKGCMPSVEHQPRLNPPMQEVVKKEIIKWLDTSVIYSIVDKNWVSRVLYMPKKGGMTMVPNKKGQVISTRPVTEWRIFMDYR